ncbi:MAG: cold shock domain-containing protein [Bacteroidota bacterium]
MDKDEKREDRKANNNKGKSFEEMLAYVDEYGRLSSTPPDPTKQRVSINLEDIQVSISRQPDVALEDGQRTGVVSFFNESKGYGFIKDTTSQESFFVHISELAQIPREGDKVTFRAEERERGLTAVEVKALV